MDRRGFLVAAAGATSLGGCLGPFTDGSRVRPGEVTCADGLDANSSNGPGRGAWPTVLHDVRNTGQATATGPTGCVQTRWQMHQEPQAGMSAGVAVSGESIYVPHQAIDDVSLVVRDAKTGTQRWQYEEVPLVPAHTPTLRHESLYLVSGSVIDAIDIPSRTSRWTLDLSEELRNQRGLTPPRVANELVYVGTDSGTVQAFDARSGNRRWTYDIDGLSHDQIPTEDPDEIANARRRGAVFAPLAVTGELVYVTSWDLHIHALDAMTGERLWSFSPGLDHQNMLHAPAVVGGTVYTQTESAITYALDARTGAKRWVFDEIGDATDGVSPLVDGEEVYAVAGTSTENLFLVALAADSGTLRWKRPIGPPMHAPVGDDNTLYLDQGQYLHALDKESGAFKWELALDDGLAAPVAVAGSAVYAVENGGSLYAVW